MMWKWGHLLLSLSHLHQRGVFLHDVFPRWHILSQIPICFLILEDQIKRFLHSKTPKSRQLSSGRYLYNFMISPTCFDLSGVRIKKILYLLKFWWLTSHAAQRCHCFENSPWPFKDQQVPATEGSRANVAGMQTVSRDSVDAPPPLNSVTTVSEKRTHRHGPTLTYLKTVSA